jgi:hypothetical protein
MHGVPHRASMIDTIESLVGGRIVVLNSSSTVQFYSDLAQKMFRGLFLSRKALLRLCGRPDISPLRPALSTAYANWLKLLFSVIFTIPTLGPRSFVSLLADEDRPTHHVPHLTPLSLRGYLSHRI